MVLSPCMEDSPFSLFKVKKKSTIVKSKIAFNTEYSAGGSIVTTPTNKKYNDVKDAAKKVCILSYFTFEVFFFIFYLYALI